MARGDALSKFKRLARRRESLKKTLKEIREQERKEREKLEAVEAEMLKLLESAGVQQLRYEDVTYYPRVRHVYRPANFGALVRLAAEVDMPAVLYQRLNQSAIEEALRVEPRFRRYVTEEQMVELGSRRS